MKKSHELTQLEICHRRGIKLDDKANHRLYTLTKGFEGESMVYQWFQTYSEGKLNIIHDYWFNHGKDMQVDLLVIMNNRWVVIEVKNYFGHFEYRSHDCYLNGKIMGDNHFKQLGHRTQRLQHIASKLNSEIKVESVMVFINEHCEVDISSEITTKIVLRHQLRFFIQSLVNNQQNFFVNKVIKHLEKYRVGSPFQPLRLDGQKVAREIRRGISCAKCNKFNTYPTYQYIRCRNCGHNEFKNKAIIRVALELRYLYYYQPTKITSQLLFEFCGESMSKRTIINSLANKFEYIKNGPKSYYEVPLLHL
ncbi:nuclease-related domain-containing protein [Aerococcaceae bacterium WGS1372]